VSEEKMMRKDTAEEEYEIVINNEEQYSLWPVDREVLAGWKTVGWRGTRQACLEHVEVIWTDMRPLSLRKKMDDIKDQAGGQNIG